LIEQLSNITAYPERSELHEELEEAAVNEKNLEMKLKRLRELPLSVVVDLC